MSQRVTKAISQAKSRAGTGWALLSPALREGLVAAELVAMLAGMDKDTASAASLQRVIDDASAIAALDL